MSVDSNSTRTVETIVAADLAVHAVLRGHVPSDLAQVPANSGLPCLSTKKINMYGGELHKSEPVRVLVDLLRQGYRAGSGDQHDLAGRSTAA